MLEITQYKTNIRTMQLQYAKLAVISKNAEFLVLAKKEEHARTDKRILRQLGMSQVTFFAHGSDAIRYLITRQKNFTTASPFCMVFCHEHLMDMDAITFSTLLQMHPLGSKVILYSFLREQMNASAPTTVSQQSHIRKFLAMGFSGVIQWPFAPIDMEKAIITGYDQHILAQKKLTRSRNLPPLMGQRDKELYEERIHEFETTMLRYGSKAPKELSYEDAYNIGCEKLKRKFYDLAVPYLMHAADNNSTCKGHALFALYLLYREQSEVTKTKFYLTKAMHSYIYANEWTYAENCVKRFSRDFAAAKNPLFLHLPKRIKVNDINGLSMIMSIASKHISAEDSVRPIVNLSVEDEIHPILYPILLDDPCLFELVQLFFQRKKEIKTLSLQQKATSQLQHNKKNKIDKKHKINKIKNTPQIEYNPYHYTRNDVIPLLPLGESKEGELIQLIQQEFITGHHRPTESTFDENSEIVPLYNQKNSSSLLRTIFSIIKHTSKMYKKTA